MPTSDSQQMATQFLYPLDDPTSAFTNALRDIGINPYRSNPFVDQLKKSASGARIAFLSNTQGGPHEDPSQKYGDYLRNNLRGGTLMNQLRGSAVGFGDMLRRVRQHEDTLSSGTSGVSLSPYDAALKEIMRADGGMGALGAYASLRSPLLGSLGGAYGRATQAAGEGAMSRYYRQGDARSDPFNWLFANSGLGPF